MGILHLGARQRLRLFIRRDTYDRFFSCLVFVPRDRFNTENRHRIERILRQATGATTIDYSTRVSESVLVRLHFLAYVDPGTLPDVDERKIETLLVAATRSWGDDLEEALVEEYGEERGEALFRRYRDAFPAGYRADWVPRSAVADVARIEELDQPDDLSLRLYRPLEAQPQRAAGEGLPRSGRRSPCPTLLPLFEDMGVQVADERPYAITPSERETVWIYDFGLTYAGDDRARGRPGPRRLPGGVHPLVARGHRERRLQPARPARRAHLARGDGPARDRPLPAPGRHDLQRPLHRAGAGRAPGRGAAARGPGARPLRPRVGGRRARRPPRREHRTRRSTRSRASTRTASCATSSTSSGRCCGRTSSSATSDGSRKSYLSFKLDPEQLPLAAPPAPALRDLRLLAAHRGRAPARREGRARRDPLVGPARGLPHRGARADEGADGQERRDRAGGREGRLRAQATAGGRRPRCAAGRGRGLLPHLHQRHARPHRQHRRRTRSRRRPTSCATTRTTRTWSSRPTRARPRCPTSPTAVADRLRLLARRRVRLGRLERLRPQADGHHRARRVGVRQAPLPRARATTSRSRTSRSSASATCRATCSATGCCCRSTSAWSRAFDHRHVFVDPDPDAARSFEERKRLFELPRSSWDDYDRELISEGGGVWSRSAKSIALSPRCARRSTCAARRCRPTT